MTSITTRFLDFIKAADPRLAEHFTNVNAQNENETDFTFAVIPTPNQNAVDPLWVSTEDDEITIGFDKYHLHLGACQEEEERIFKESLEIIDQIRNDELVVASWWVGQQFVSSMLCVTDEPSLKPEEGYTLRIRSWSGSKDREESA
jgi:hypothetical protein